MTHTLNPCSVTDTAIVFCFIKVIIITFMKQPTPSHGYRHGYPHAVTDTVTDTATDTQYLHPHTVTSYRG